MCQDSSPRCRAAAPVLFPAPCRGVPAGKEKFGGGTGREGRAREGGCALKLQPAADSSSATATEHPQQHSKGTFLIYYGEGILKASGEY